MIKVEQNIPLADGKQWSAKYPWKTMEVGQSFYLAGGNLDTMRSGCSSAGKRLNRKFVARRADRDGGIRVWRLA